MRRRWVLPVTLVASSALAAAGAGVISEDAAGARATAICHKTSSKTRPYVRLRVSPRNLRAHLRHADDIIPAAGACPRTLLTATTGGQPLTVTLTGVAERPAPADPDATGTATLRLRRGQGRLCFTLNAANLTLPAAGAHIHRGTADETGPIVVPLRAPAAGGTARGCVAVSRALVRELLSAPTQFYVNVHTTEFPGGAIRGQLRPAPTVRIFSVSLTGAAERPNPGDPDASGTAGIRIDTTTGQVCFTFAVRNIQLPSVGAHIHRGGPAEAGPIVVPLTAPGATGTSSGCVTATTALAQEIAQNPGAFYVNVHTREFPGGAVRGQVG